MWRRKFLLCVIGLFTIMTSSGQSIINSPYTIYGLGDIAQKGSGYNWSLGGTGIGIRDDLSFNNSNPASYTSIIPGFTQLADFSFNFSIAQQSEGNNSSPSYYGAFSGAAFWFRPAANAGLVVGLRPYSKIKYNIAEERSFTGIEGEYDVNYQGEGGLSQVYVGTAYEFFSHLSVGINFSYIFGNLAHNQYISSEDVNYEMTIEKKLYLNTFQLDYGIQYEQKFGKEKIVLGATFSNKRNFGGSYEENIYQNEDTLQENIASSKQYLLPVSIGSGFSWTHNNKWMFAADYSHEQWNEATFDEGYRLRDTQRYSAGLAFIPNLNAFEYVKRIGFNLGGYYKNTYLELDGQGIDQFGITTGVKLPTSGTAIINLVYERSFRGFNTVNLVNENFHHFTVNVTFFDLWFRKNKFQ